MPTQDSGVPIGLSVEGANVPDNELLEPTLENSEEAAPEVPEEVEENRRTSTWTRYDHSDVRELVAEVHGYTSHIRSRGEEARELRREAGEKARRWVVERCHGWLNKFGLLQFACAYFTLQREGVFG